MAVAELGSLDGTMRTFIAILLVLMLITCWLVLEIRAKSKYDQARRDDAVAYSVTPMDQQTVAFLARVQSSWTCWEDITNGADSETLKLVGKSPTVRNLIETFNYEMPAFQWFSPSQNRQAAAVNLVKAKFMPVSLDKQWHISADEHITFLICKSNIVALYQDEPTGLRASYYVEKKGAVIPSNNALEPTATAPPVSTDK